MPKWIMRLVPDVPLGAEVWVSAASPFGQIQAVFAGCLACSFAHALKLDGIGSTMVNFPGRNDRRRRVLKEEVRTAAGSRSTLRANVAEDAPRYSDAAGVENHPQVTDFVPRRYSTIALLGLFGVAATAVTSAVHYFALPIAAARSLNSVSALDLSARGNLTEWLAAVVLFMASGFCVLTYSIRRHRIDDYRGRYRIWLGAALACLVLSANSVTGLHEMMSDVLTRATGWSALRDGAAWWMALAGLPLTWIVIRVMLDIRECRIAAALLAGAVVCYGVSAASFLGYGPRVEARVQPIIMAAPLLLGHWLAFTAIVANARFVVLDAQGLVTVRSRSKTKRTESTVATKASASKATHSSATSSSSKATIGISRETVQAVTTPADSNRWVDGSRFERERYDSDEEEESSDGGRKLSKSDRKRLRKMKSEGRAA
jgi:hypothetical protein